jgi:hypothetical protein
MGFFECVVPSSRETRGALDMPASPAATRAAAAAAAAFSFASRFLAANRCSASAWGFFKKRGVKQKEERKGKRLKTKHKICGYYSFLKKWLSERDWEGENDFFVLVDVLLEKRKHKFKKNARKNFQIDQEAGGKDQKKRRREGEGGGCGSDRPIHVARLPHRPRVSPSPPPP